VNTVKFTWQEFDEAADELASRIKTGTKVRAIFGIPRGGLVLAVALSHRLSLPVITTFGGRHTLIVDDISDTGRTLKYYQLRGYRTATIHFVQGSVCVPDYHVRIKDRSDWVVYPWEVYGGEE